MTTSADPSIHRAREQQLMAHVQKLLTDDRLRVDTVRGNRSITTLIRDVSRSDHATDLRRTMSELDKPDRDLERTMPAGENIEVILGQRRFLFFRQTVGRLRVICSSPTRALLTGQTPEPMSTSDVSKLLNTLPPSVGSAPQTIVLMSTSGFSMDAHELATRGAARTVVLVEPNEAGGWTVTGPPEAKSITDLFDPEDDGEKRQRAQQAISEARLELSQGGLSMEKLAARTRLPAGVVEAEMKAYAKSNPGLVAKKLDGRYVLYREGTAPAAANSSAAGGSSMPLIDRMKALFSGKGDDEKKLAFLSERKIALSQQRDQSYEDMTALETQEEALRRQFKEATGSITKKRVTSQLLQLRKDIERRQQLLGVLNQQINVVSTHLHNLELVRQGHSAHLPDADEITSDAVKAEEMLAELEANAEVVGSVATSAGSTGLTSEEQALFEELESESRAEKAGKAEKSEPAVLQPEKPQKQASSAPPEPSRQRQASTPPPLSTPRRSEPEAG